MVELSDQEYHHGLHLSCCRDSDRCISLYLCLLLHPQHLHGKEIWLPMGRSRVSTVYGPPHLANRTVYCVDNHPLGSELHSLDSIISTSPAMAPEAPSHLHVGTLSTHDLWS